MSLRSSAIDSQWRKPAGILRHTAPQAGAFFGNSPSGTGAKPLPVFARTPIPVPFLPGRSFTSLHFRHMPLIEFIIQSFGYMSITVLSEIETVIFRRKSCLHFVNLNDGPDCHELRLPARRPVFSSRILRERINFSGEPRMYPGKKFCCIEELNAPCGNRGFAAGRGPKRCPRDPISLEPPLPEPAQELSRIATAA